MTTFVFVRDSVRLQVFDSGVGMPVIFQHGLGGDEVQVAGTFPDGPGIRRLTMECRAHGSSGAGRTRPFSMSLFAADLLAACDHLGFDRFVIGGISMGAALALKIAVSQPDRVRGLILARPAWGFDRAPPNMRPFTEVAAGLLSKPPAEAKANFVASPIASTLAIEAPDNLASLLRFFDRPQPRTVATLLANLAADGPEVSREAAAALKVPSLVIGHGKDFVHPLSLAEDIAGTLPRARLAVIAPKVGELERHVTQFRAAVHEFLQTLAP